MYLLNKRADTVTADDISRLIQNSVPESRSLDYKRELKLSQDKDKKEFLFDVTSFYNTEGGCLIYGIEESKDERNQNTGNPEKIVGLIIENQDKLSQQIEDVIKAGTEPAIANIILNFLIVADKNILVIGISKGMNLPAMVTFNESNKFYRRRNSGKYAVDVYELKEMFLQSQILKQSAESFRVERLDKIKNKQVFQDLDLTASLVIDIIPFSFLADQMVDLSNASNMGITTMMRPVQTSGWDHLHNADGFATFAKHYTGPVYSYDQLIRNGVYEIYTSGIFLSTELSGKVVNCLYRDYIIPTIMEKVKDGLLVLKKFQIEAPVLIGISILNVLGGAIKSEMYFSKPFTTNDILLPLTIVPTSDADIYQHLKPIFDLIWQSAGMPKAPVYQ